VRGRSVGTEALWRVGANEEISGPFGVEGIYQAWARVLTHVRLEHGSLSPRDRRSIINKARFFSSSPAMAMPRELKKTMAGNARVLRATSLHQRPEGKRGGKKKGRPREMHLLE